MIGELKRFPDTQCDPFLLLGGRMTNEMREVFVGMGSTLIKSLKHRDSWVFAGRAGAQNKSPFEMVSLHFVLCVSEKTTYFKML